LAQRRPVPLLEKTVSDAVGLEQEPTFRPGQPVLECVGWGLRCLVADANRLIVGCGYEHDLLPQCLEDCAVIGQYG